MDRTVDVKGKRGFDELLADRRGIYDAPHYRGQCEAISDAIVKALRRGNKVLWMGNGGSAAEAQHMAAELSGRFLRERPGLYSEALSVNTSTLTAVGNDYGYDLSFARQIRAFASPGDVAIALSTSGGSANVLRAIEAARDASMLIAVFTGANGDGMAALADIPFVIPSTVTARIQEAYMLYSHILCEGVERELFAPAAD